MSTKEQGLALPATLLPVLLAALGILPLGTRGGLRCVSSPTPNTSPGPLSIGITFSSGQPGITILILCGRPNYNFNFSPGSPESALQTLALPSVQTQNLLNKCGARMG